MELITHRMREIKQWAGSDFIYLQANPKQKPPCCFVPVLSFKYLGSWNTVYKVKREELRKISKIII